MEVFKFANPQYLYALLIIPAMILLFVGMLYWRKKSLKRFGDNRLLSILVPDFSKGWPVVRLILLIAGFTFLIFAIADPQFGSKLEEVKRQGVDLVICLDVSNSMNAQDIKPSRLESAKRSISRLIDQLKGDRIGIVVFAGQAYVQLPITTDYSAARMFLTTINTDIVSTQGTAIAEAINTAMNSFNFDDAHSKAIVIITDGEDHEGDAIKAAQTAAEKGVKLFTIGMGLPEGSPIPILDNRGNVMGYRKDREGNTVVTKLDEVILQQLASIGSGMYVRANTSRAGLELIYEEINKMEKSEFDAKMFSDYEHQFQILLMFALSFTVIELFVLERKGRLQKKIKLFNKTNY
ncbi:MAG: VWA domain-containing protein [Bacteroidales bacterium]|jgi:Ca-activated chloride channel family protein|nr:VWA domain-containing protein [Bacteroidales bacterium]